MIRNERAAVPLNRMDAHGTRAKALSQSVTARPIAPHLRGKVFVIEN
jgi:hypothetical protein